MRNPLAGTGLRRYTRAHLRHDRDAARALVLRLEGDLRQADTALHALREEIARLRADAVDVGVERKLRQQAERKVDALTARPRIFEADVANATAISLPPAHRDIDADDQATEPQGIPVITLPAALSTA